MEGEEDIVVRKGGKGASQKEATVAGDNDENIFDASNSSATTMPDIVIKMLPNPA